jgi:hypothetical protein
MDATQVVDLIHETEAFTWRSWVIRVVVGSTHINALCRTHTGAQFAPDALFHSIFVTVQNMTAMHALWLVDLFVLDVIVLATKYAAA